MDLTRDFWRSLGGERPPPGLALRLIEADMLAMPLPDAAFDRVLSSFGALLADDPPVMARELVRICRRGGLVAVTGWTPDGVFDA